MQPGKDLSTELLVLNSLFPVVKLLPGLTREKNSGYYYVQGRIEASDQESLYNYTKYVGEITLGAEPDSKSRVAPHVLARIAQFQDPNRPLFQNLHRLRIVNTSSSLNFLHLLLSSTLTTLELTAIPVNDPCYSSVLSFLECAIHHAPLSTLILGPGLIPDQILDLSLMYKHLRRLELLNIGNSITDQLLQHIGSLQHLEAFVLRANGTSTYKPSPAISSIPAITEQVIAPGQTPPSEVPNMQALEHNATPAHTAIFRSPSPSQWSQCSSPEPTVSHVRSGLANPKSPAILDAGMRIVDSAMFSALQTLEVCGSFGLIEDLVAKVSSADLRMLTIDFTESLKLIQFKGKAKVAHARVLGGSEVAETPKQKSTTVQPGQQSPSLLSTANVVGLIRHSIQKWTTLVAVIFVNNNTIPFPMPLDVFKDLLLRPDMKHLEINRMGIDSMDTALHHLGDSKLEVLHLPFHSIAPVISLARLRYIAEACPHLKSFRCRFDDVPNIPVSVPLSHQLEELSVANAQAYPEQQQLLDIACYLDSIFPNLKSIKTRKVGGRNNAGQWIFIFDLVKLCQAARMNGEHRRLKLEGSI